MPGKQDRHYRADFGLFDDSDALILVKPQPNDLVWGMHCRSPCAMLLRITFPGIPKQPCCTRSLRKSWKRSCTDSKSGIARSHISSNRNFAPFSTAVFSRGGRSSHTKYDLQNLPERVEVTRRHHPLFGRELEVIRANKVMLTIRLRDGSTMKVPRAWTNAGRATGVVEPPCCSVLTNEGVRELIDLVSAMRRRD